MNKNQKEKNIIMPKIIFHSLQGLSPSIWNTYDLDNMYKRTYKENIDIIHEIKKELVKKQQYEIALSARDLEKNLKDVMNKMNNEDIKNKLNNLIK